MLTPYNPKWNITELTDTEISRAIRYLDSGSDTESDVDSKISILFIYISLMLILSFVAFTCLYCIAG